MLNSIPFFEGGGGGGVFQMFGFFLFCFVLKGRDFASGGC